MKRSSRSLERRHEPIAIVGIGCRFPGASGPEALWTLLLQGADRVGEVPVARFDVDAVYDPRPGIPGKLLTRAGGFLDGIDGFDAAFFAISPREAASMDPQQRLVLEVAFEAIEDGGQVLQDLKGSRTGVFIGLCYNDYEDLHLRRLEDIDIYTNIGGARSLVPGRLSFALGLQGPSIAVDAACASSLVAVHLACQSLRAGECDLALAGGVNLILQPEFSIGFSRAGMLASDGRCKFGDARADGFVRSEGIGLLVLKRLTEAHAESDPIRAVIRGSAVNNDGRSGGFLMTPARAGQEEVLQAAYRAAGVDPSCVHYVEAHGTGTRAGDPVELAALGAVLGPGRRPDRRLVVGSIKTNLGHTEGAAGVAGLIKTALALQHRTIPASLHLREPSPEIAWAELPLDIARSRRDWPACDGPALAGVSAFGINGTNVHVVLEEAPPLSAEAASEHEEAPSAHLIALSAPTRSALAQTARNWVSAVRTGKLSPRLGDVSYTSTVRRSHHQHRLGVVVRSHSEIEEKLEAFLGEEPSPGVWAGHAPSGRVRRVAFVFPGQGSQWAGMGRELYESRAAFREALDACDAAVRGAAGWSVIEELARPVAESRLECVEIIQPALFAIQVALAALWRSLAIEPEAVVGHSLGEIAAAHVAGALSLEDAARVICERSVLVRETSGRGGMLAAEFGSAAAAALVERIGEGLAVAAQNGPRSCLLSGPPDALGSVEEELARREILCRRVKVDYASHGPQMEGLLPRLREKLAAVRPREGRCCFLSTVVASPVDGATLGADYWAQNLRLPVLFWPAVERLLGLGVDTFIEISPHPVLLGGLLEGVRGRDADEVLLLSSLRRGEDEWGAVLESLGRLHVAGQRLDWERLSGPGARCVPLPAHSWERESFWIEEPERTGRPLRRASVRIGGVERPAHPMLASHFESSTHSGVHHWEMALDLRSLPYLADHRVGDEVVLPAAAYVEMARAAAEEIFGAGPHSLEQLCFLRMRTLAEGSPAILQLTLTQHGDGRAEVEFRSREGEGAVGESWMLHATAVIRAADVAAGEAEERTAKPEEIRERCALPVSADEHYAAMAARSLRYGACFQGVELVWRGEGEALGRVRVPEPVAWQCDAYGIHPALLDACFQVLEASLVGEGEGEGEECETYLPVAIGRFRLLGRPDGSMWSHVVWSEAVPRADFVEADVRLLDDSGRVVGEARRLRAQKIDRTARARPIGDLLYQFDWRAEEDAAASCAPAELGWGEGPSAFLVFAEAAGVGEALAAALQADGANVLCVTQGPEYAALGDGRYRIDPTRREDYDRLLLAVGAPGRPVCRAVVHLWSLDASDEEETLTTIEAAQRAGCASAILLVQALADSVWSEAPRLWLVTRGVHAIAADDRVAVAQAPLWGLGRVIAHEYPELRCTRVDLAGSDRESEQRALLRELRRGDDEEEVAWRAGRRHVHRLVRLQSEELGAAVLAEAEQDETVPVADRPFRLETRSPGVLDHLEIREARRGAPGVGEIEIDVRALGLNFRDVMLAMGLLPPVFAGSIDFGWECVGRVIAVGAGVDAAWLGADVVAVAPGCFGRFARTPLALAVPKPPALTDEESVTIPIVFLTVHYALHHLARLQRGERILVHAATGGVGLAALQYAKRVGAEIFATAGSPEKRDYLHSLGIPHVMDSRSLAFTQEVLEATRGEGVDIVLNSLSGPAIPASLSTLRARGRFVELGKTDILQNRPLGLAQLQNNISFFAVDLARMFLDEPGYCGRLFQEVARLFEEGALRPLPRRVFPVSQTVDAFRHLAQARHIGKVVVSLADPDARMIPAPRERFRGDATYLITGGLGGLGRTVAEWMLEQGARNLVLIGRRGTSDEATEVVERLRARGARVETYAADVASRAELSSVIAAMDRSMPPLRGVIHAAGVLDDGLLRQIDTQRLRTVMRPKVAGAWNLHVLLADRPLDFFVLFSSAASLLGSPAQASYAAANAFLDALAGYRRARGLPALSIGWGPWAEVGLAAAQANRGARLSFRGVGSLAPSEGLEALGYLLEREVSQVGVLPFDLRRWCEFYPRDETASLLSVLAAEQESRAQPGAPGDEMRAALRALDSASARRRLLESHVLEQASRVLRLAVSRIDPKRALGELGLDSLMSMELKNRLEASLGMRLPSTLIWNYPSATSLSAQLAERLGVAVDDVDTPEEPTAEDAEMEEFAAIVRIAQQLDESVLHLSPEAASNGAGKSLEEEP